mgnify:CR=1 FL=1
MNRIPDTDTYIQQLRIYILRIREQVRFLTSDLIENDGTFVTVRARELARLEQIMQEEPKLPVPIERRRSDA